MNKKVKRKKIRFKGLLVILLFLYLIGNIGYYFYKMPIKKIEISGNKYLKDNYIINYLKLDNKSIFEVSKNKIKKSLLSLELVDDAMVSKNYLGTIKISIKESSPLFYNLSSQKIVLANGREIANSGDYLGLPILINYVEDDVYQELKEKLNKIDRDILNLVSEMEYSPSIVQDKVVDAKRFLFRMNDGNTVYINTTNIEKLNDYIDIYEAIVNKNGDIKGCLYLDSNSTNNHFNNCESPIVNNGDGDNNG